MVQRGAVPGDASWCSPTTTRCYSLTCFIACHLAVVRASVCDTPTKFPCDNAMGPSTAMAFQDSGKDGGCPAGGRYYDELRKVSAVTQVTHDALLATKDRLHGADPQNYRTTLLVRILTRLLAALYAISRAYGCVFNDTVLQSAKLTSDISVEDFSVARLWRATGYENRRPGAALSPARRQSSTCRPPSVGSCCKKPTATPLTRSAARTAAS